MNREERLRAVLEAVFGPEGLRLTEADGPGTTPMWDSVAHLNLILAVEAEFDVTFPIGEIAELVSLQAIRVRLEQRDRR